jgi:hypothetical protein
MSPSTVRIFRESRTATDLSVSSINGELSKTVTSAPAAAKIGPCTPPPEAKQSIFKPSSGGNHSRGTGIQGVRLTCQLPAFACLITSGPAGIVYLFPYFTLLSQAI